MVIPSIVCITPCITYNMSPERREKLKEYYRVSKKYGIRASFAAVTGSGLFGLVKEVAKDGVKRHGKRYLGGILATSGLSCISGGIPLITNSTKIVKYSKNCHSVCAAAWRAAHSSSDLPFIALDFLIFGEFISSCGECDYDLYNNTTNFINEFID